MPNADYKKAIEAAVDEVCACQDMACANAAGRKLKDEIQRQNLSPDDRRELENGPLAKRADACVQRLEADVQKTRKLLERTTDEVCACPDMKCVDAVGERLQRTLDSEHVSQAQWNRAGDGALGQRLEQCATRLKPDARP